ncbi:LCP family protein [Streptomyces sp. NPDC095613]|uniref:LCP family protein n=1 Tax=Streptomyces sp. NPDC095613 TaxID=3155540 RepID=UPI003331B5C3
MDTDVTDSAGSAPAAPEGSPGDGPTPRTPGPDDKSPAESADNDADGHAGEHQPDRSPSPTDGPTDGPAGSPADSSADDPAGPADEAGDATDVPAPHPAPRKRRWLRWAALGSSAAVLAVAGTGWWFYRSLDANITTDTSAAAELRAYEKERPTPVSLEAQNILLIGSDSRAGAGNGKYGRDDGGSQRSDTTILLHLAADRQSATAVSLPRDLMVDTPSCRAADGSRTEARFAQFNWAFETGGAACTIRTVEKLTGIRVDHHMVIDFQGFKDVVDAVGGVDVCLAEPVDDRASKLELPAGPQRLDGEQALGFVRVRHGIGDGSDTERMQRQQSFLGSLFKKVSGNGVLLNPAELYPVLDAATKSLTTDPGLGSLTDLYELARSLQSVPTEKVQFLTAPRQPYSADPNRDELVQPDADELFERLREDRPVTVETAKSAGDSEAGDSRETPAPTGTTAGKKDSNEDHESVEENIEERTNGEGREGRGAGKDDSGHTVGSTDAMTGSAPDPTYTGTNASHGMCG